LVMLCALRRGGIGKQGKTDKNRARQTHPDGRECPFLWL
jgi:hypothetical protein